MFPSNVRMKKLVSGQSDIKKLRRENYQLRKEIWSLRDEYDRLGKLLKVKTRSNFDDSDIECHDHIDSDCKYDCELYDETDRCCSCHSNEVCEDFVKFKFEH